MWEPAFFYFHRQTCDRFRQKHTNTTQLSQTFIKRFHDSLTHITKFHQTLSLEWDLEVMQ